MELSGIEPESYLEVSVYKARRQAPQSASQVKGKGLDLLIGEDRIRNRLTKLLTLRLEIEVSVLAVVGVLNGAAPPLHPATQIEQLVEAIIRKIAGESRKGTGCHVVNKKGQ